MSYPVAAGVRDMAATDMRYIPALYSPKLLVKFYDATCLSDIANTDYEGEIKEQGDTVYIRTTPDITISDYKKGGGLTYEQPKSAPVTLSIDKGKSWAFVANKVDQKQTDIKKFTDKWTDSASNGMKVEIETDVFADIYADVPAANKGATAGAKRGLYNLGVDGGAAVEITAANAINVILRCGAVLDEQNAPDEGRWIIIPAWLAMIIKSSDLKDASMTGDGVSPLRNGRLGMIDRFTLYKSNLLTTTHDTGSVHCDHVLFGHKSALTFASQMTENEVLVNPNDFGTLFRGLQIYGYEVVKTEMLGDLFCKMGS